MTAAEAKKDVRTERGKIYGDPQEMHSNIAAVWSAQLRARFGPGAPVLDAQMAELMLAGFKVLRASRPVPDDPAARAGYMDSFPDAGNYLDFAREAVALRIEVSPAKQIVFVDPAAHHA